MKSTQDSQHKGNIIDTAQGCSVIACNTCGFTHILPLPTKEALKVFYEKKFYDSEKINYFKDAEKDATWWLNVYRSHYAILSKHTTGRHLLDIGSGPGYFLKCGIDLGWDVLGVEPSNKAFQYSTKKLKVPVPNFESIIRKAKATRRYVPEEDGKRRIANWNDPFEGAGSHDIYEPVCVDLHISCIK